MKIMVLNLGSTSFKFKLFEMDGVALNFDREALETIAAQAIERNTGARGLRSIMEGIMLPMMYDIPSREDLAEVHIDKDCLPQYVTKVPLMDDVPTVGELAAKNEE